MIHTIEVCPMTVPVSPRSFKCHSAVITPSIIVRVLSRKLHVTMGKRVESQESKILINAGPRVTLNNH